jgi:hypothetical protein
MSDSTDQKATEANAAPPARWPKSLTELRAKLGSQSFGSWLLEGFESGTFSHLMAIGPPSSESDLFLWWFANLSVGDQEELKAAIGEAVGQWHPVLHSYSTLRELSETALHVLAECTIPVIRRKIESGAFSDWKQIAELVDTIAGFGGAVEPAYSLYRLFDRAELHPEVTPNLVLGLAKARPDEFPNYLPRFLEHAQYYDETRDEGFRPWMAMLLVEFIGWRTLKEKQPQRDAEMLDAFDEYFSWGRLVEQLKEAIAVSCEHGVHFFKQQFLARNFVHVFETDAFPQELRVQFFETTTNILQDEEDISETFLSLTSQCDPAIKLVWDSFSVRDAYSNARSRTTNLLSLQERWSNVSASTR